MYMPHTVTLYNVEHITDPETFEDVFKNNITILHGVFMDASRAANIRATGLESADFVNLYVPFDVDATDGITGEPKKYIDTIEYWNLSDKSGYYTFTEGRNTFFVKGVAVEPDKDDGYINLAYDDVYRVTKVDKKDFGSPAMQHFEIGGA